MSTRGAIGLRFLGIEKATYNHSDSYPTWLGARVIETIRQFNDEQLAGAANRVTLISDDVPPTPEQIDRYRPFSNTGVSTGQLTDWYCLLREAQGEFAPYIDGRIDVMVDNADYRSPDTWCEWAYIIDMDARTLEIYECPAPNPSVVVPLDTIRAWTDEQVSTFLELTEQGADA